MMSEYLHMENKLRKERAKLEHREVEGWTQENQQAYVRDEQDRPALGFEPNAVTVALPIRLLPLDQKVLEVAASKSGGEAS
jgi:hypothetical protein